MSLAKATSIKQGVLRFKQVFQPLFLKGLPNFWDAEGKLIPQYKYVELLIKVRSDHFNFEGLVKGLKGKVVVGKVRDDFELSVGANPTMRL